MTDREKLTKLIEESFADQHNRRRMIVVPDTVNYLLANGVVVREWIPVTERLPDLELVEAMSNDTDFYPCLAVVKHERLMGRGYISKLWYDKNGFIDGDCIDRTSSVTHWMPLPEPPIREGENDG